MSVIYGNPITLGGGGKPKKLLSSLTEGSLVSVLEDGKLVPFYVAKHNYEADLNGEGRTLLVRKDIHSKQYWHTTNTNTYAGSFIDTWLNGDYKALLSNTVQGNMALTSFDYSAGNTTAVTTLSRGLFLLSLAEVGLSASDANQEGEKLPIGDALKIAYLDGTATNQWSRTPANKNTQYAYVISSAGAISGGNPTSAQGIRPCFTLPADMPLRSEPYADGSWGLVDEYEPTDTVDITDNGIHNVKEFSFANVNVAPVLLWTNASPTSNFAPQTISLSETWDAFIIEIQYAGFGAVKYGRGFLNVGEPGYIGIYFSAASGTGRIVTSTTVNSVVFGDAKQGADSIANTACTPTRIWGVKFTL